MRTITKAAVKRNTKGRQKQRMGSPLWAGIVLLALLLSPVCVFSAAGQAPNNVTLTWDPSTSPGVVSYRIYYGGVSGVYTNSVMVGNTTTYTISNLISGATYYFAITAYDGNGVESSYSGEISYTVPRPPASLRLVMAANKRAILTMTGTSGHTYQILASTNLTSWSVIGTVTLGASGTAGFTDTNAPGYSKRYYRLRDTSL